MADDACVTPRTRSFQGTYIHPQKAVVLGKGAFGTAFLVAAAASPDQQLVAKELPVFGLTEKQRQQVIAEGEVLRSLCHRNVVACFDAFLTGTYMYIVMEFASGGDLSHRIQLQRDSGGLFEEYAILCTFLQLCKALQYIHSKKVLHRDLKSANIFVCGNHGSLASATVKIGDFGLCKVSENSTFEAISAVGSPHYFSPELCRGRPYGRKSDIWSLGIVLYELARLQVPFSAKVIPAVALMICTKPVPAMPPFYSRDLEKMIKWLLEKQPEKRPTAGSILRSSMMVKLMDLERKSAPDAMDVNEAPAEIKSPEATPPSSPDGVALQRSLTQGGQLSRIPEHEPAEGTTRFGAPELNAILSGLDPGDGRIATRRLARLFTLLEPSLSEAIMCAFLRKAASYKDDDTVESMEFLQWLLGEK
eukprot:TRINITY_DN38454_c0_g1_i1.p1 TRINITY_DN38454_c0_g1~~TRINITY_DN38454_c0_g1_i1.p1  ORF type:complete len:419 (-),score=78.63 TRINITY_DN38454_c0_g1_i1:137-1393(-)